MIKSLGFFSNETLCWVSSEVGKKHNFLIKPTVQTLFIMAVLIKSFICMIISLFDLVSMCKMQNNP